MIQSGSPIVLYWFTTKEKLLNANKQTMHACIPICTFLKLLMLWINRPHVTVNNDYLNVAEVKSVIETNYCYHNTNFRCGNMLSVILISRFWKFENFLPASASRAWGWQHLVRFLNTIFVRKCRILVPVRWQISAAGKFHQCSYSMCCLRIWAFGLPVEDVSAGRE